MQQWLITHTFPENEFLYIQFLQELNANVYLDLEFLSSWFLNMEQLCIFLFSLSPKIWLDKNSLYHYLLNTFE